VREVAAGHDLHVLLELRERAHEALADRPADARAHEQEDRAEQVELLDERREGLVDGRGVDVDRDLDLRRIGCG
jgi:hypothetical protein